MVSPAEDDFANERFDGPAVVGELKGEVVEQFGMAGKFAGPAKVIGGADEAFAEEVFPNPVGHDAGGEGVVGIGNPSGELESSGTVRGNGGGGVGFHCDREKAAGHFFSFVADLATNADVVVGRGL